MVGLITDNNETAYREEVRDLAVWCQNNKLSFNVIKTNEMIVDHRKKEDRSQHFHRRGYILTIPIDRAAVEQVESFKCLGVHITNKLT